MLVEVSNGELVDKVTILSIKLKKIKSKDKLVNIQKEFDHLSGKLKDIGFSVNNKEYNELVNVNTKLWEIEDKIRVKEAKQEFDDEFIKLARSVYFENDKRFEIKKRINNLTSSSLHEEKEYVNYKK